MKRIPGIVSPGKAGLIMLVAALVPVAAKQAKPLVRAVGRGIKRVGEAIERIVDSSQIDAEPEPQVVNEPTPEPTPSEKAKKAKKSKPKKED